MAARMERSGSLVSAARQEYPNHVPLKVAAAFFGVSPRQLSWLIAERREPFASVGANIGTTQRYIRIYTEPLLRYLSCEGTGL